MPGLKSAECISDPCSAFLTKQRGGQKQVGVAKPVSGSRRTLLRSDSTTPGSYYGILWDWTAGSKGAILLFSIPMARWGKKTHNSPVSMGLEDILHPLALIPHENWQAEGPFPFLPLSGGQTWQPWLRGTPLANRRGPLERMIAPQGSALAGVEKPLL